MQIIKRIFGGRQVAILIGHREFELMFVSSQIAEIAHIANPAAARALTMEATDGYGFLPLGEVLPGIVNPQAIDTWGVAPVVGETWLSSSAATYRMLLRTNSPWAGLFRTWHKDYALPEVREIPPDTWAIEATQTDLSEGEELRATIRLLERQLSSERRRSHDLEETLKETNASLMRALLEAASLRRGVPYASSVAPPTDLLSRAQQEFDRQLPGWKSAWMREEVSILNAESDEQWFRHSRTMMDREKRAELTKA